MQKNNFRYIKTSVLTLLLAAFSMQSCDKDVTELSPFDRITEQLAFSSPARVELSMVGVYDAAQSGFYAGDRKSVV